MNKVITISVRLFMAMLAGLLLVACADREDESYEGAESRSLHEWMKINHSDLVGNYQTKGGYYVAVQSIGDLTTPAVSDTVCWVRLEFTGRDLAGNVCMTRNELTARQLGSFTFFTHYTPFFKFCGDMNGSFLEGVYLALRDELTLGAEYAKEHGLTPVVKMRKGTELVLYMSSSVIGIGGADGSGGYGGQEFGGVTYSLSDSRPMIVRMKVVEVIKNPIAAEGSEVDAFAEQNGKLKPLPPKPKPDPKISTNGRDEQQYHDGYAWRNAIDSIPQLYVNYAYFPSTKADSLFKYRQTYQSSTSPYQNMADLDKKINEALIKRFGTGTLDGDSVKLDGTAKIWYIGRFLDGFIFDTNIDEVKKIIYGKVDTKGAVISYTPKLSQKKYIDAWYYTVPSLRFGQWATLVSTSSHCYGATGKEGSSTTSTTGGNSSANYDMMNYYNMMNSSYGNSYYGNYYGNYYGDYYNNYYDDTTSNTNTTGVSTTTTVSTEIQSYTPLIFQMYIEKKE
ncbi:MAG: hypothetical protein RR330_04730 [Alistipes sp.]